MKQGKSISKAAEALRRGLLVIMPTDTLYGVAAVPWLDSAEERLYEVKSRDRGKPVPLLAADTATVFASGVVAGPIERNIAEKFWPGAVTLVLKVRRGQDDAVYEGFRVPDCDTARALLKEVGGLLRVSSANISGEPPALTAQEAVSALGAGVDYVLDDGPVKGGVASTVVRIDGDELIILREGAVSREELLECIEKRNLR